MSKRLDDPRQAHPGGRYQRSSELGARASVVEVMRLLLVASLLLASCFSTTHVDYIDFVKANGITYVGVDYFNVGTGVGRTLVDADLGPEQFRVKQMLSDGSKGLDYRPGDGDSAFVPSGQPVYAVEGYATTFRLAARHDGRLVLYEADSNPAAKTGRDLLDIEGKVVGIALVSGKDGRTILGRITERSRIDDLVRLVLSAPVDQNPPPSSPTPSRTPLPVPTPTFATPNYGFAVAFQLADDSATQRRYDIEGGILHRGIFVAGAFRSAVEELVAAAPTPTPVPATVNLVTKYELAKATGLTMKQVHSGPVQDAARLSKIVAALDAELPAMRTGPMVSEATGLIFEFPDHLVVLTYDAGSGLLRVTSPDDEFAVRPGAELRQLLEEAR
jgi:hypothetical protein